MSGFILGKAGKSPSFQDPGTPLDGLAGTWIPVSSIGLMTGLLGVPNESFDVDSYTRVPLGLAGTRVLEYSLAALILGAFHHQSVVNHSL